MRARHTSLLLLVIMIMSLLTGCMLSDEEKAIKIEVENIAKPYIESFVKENYNEWEINSLECMIGNKEEFSFYASDFVKAAITNKNYKEQIEIVYDTKNNETFVRDENLPFKDKISEYLGVPKDTIVDITFEYKPLQVYDLFPAGGLNYYKVGETDTSKYKINIVANCEKKTTVDKIRETLKRLSGNNKVEYEILIVQGYTESALRKTQGYMKKHDNCSLPSVSERCTVTVFRGKDSTDTEETIEFKKLAIDGGYIIYNGTMFDVKATQKNTSLGIEESVNSKIDTELTISKKDKSADMAQINIFSTTNTHVVIEDSDGIKSVSELTTWGNKIFTLDKLRVKTYEKYVKDKETVTLSLITKEK